MKVGILHAMTRSSLITSFTLVHSADGYSRREEFTDIQICLTDGTLGARNSLMSNLSNIFTSRKRLEDSQKIAHKKIVYPV